MNTVETWWTLMNTDETWWTLMKMDEAWWILMNHDENGCTLMNIDETWWKWMNIDEHWWTLMNIDETWWKWMNIEKNWWKQWFSWEKQGDIFLFGIGSLVSKHDSVRLGSSGWCSQRCWQAPNLSRGEVRGAGQRWDYVTDIIYIYYVYIHTYIHITPYKMLNFLNSSWCTFHSPWTHLQLRQGRMVSAVLRKLMAHLRPNHPQRAQMMYGSWKMDTIYGMMGNLIYSYRFMMIYECFWVFHLKLHVYPRILTIIGCVM
jgi:hypothetical protein